MRIFPSLLQSTGDTAVEYIRNRLGYRVVHLVILRLCIRDGLVLSVSLHLHLHGDADA